MRAKPKSAKSSKRAKLVSAPPLPTAPYEVKAQDEALIARQRDHDRTKPLAARLSISRQQGREVKICIEPATGQHENERNALRAGAARLRQAFGGTSLDAAQGLLNSVINSTRTKDGASERAVNEALALVEGIEPLDTVEAMLAVQMVATHGLIAELQRRMLNTVENIPQQDSNGALLVKLLRTFATQIDTLKRYRSSGEQRVSVTHQHVTVNADKAAVAVNATGVPGGGAKTKEQPHEPRAKQLAHAAGDPLPSTFEANGEAVPQSGG